MKILCPSKTFFLGEYAVLHGGDALLLATEPYFEWENNMFKDPHQGRGGFGASGAKFVFETFQENCTDALSALNKFQSASLKGSGADIICQYTGGITFYSPTKGIKKLHWPFPQLYIALIHTGFKTLTHTHLDEINVKDYDFSSLEEIVLSAYQAFTDQQQNRLIDCIQLYQKKLHALQLVCDNTLRLLDKINHQSFTLAAKGCGALGSDVILAAISQQDAENFLSFTRREKLQVVYCGNHFADGVKNIP